MAVDILFIQLPLVDHGLNYIDGNITYAPAAISAYIKRNINKEISLETLPLTLANFASDKVIIQYIEKLSPGIISFTAYLWNIERSLDIAKKVKKEGRIIIFGGPEISEGSVALETAHPFVDFFIQGEGEWFFQKYFSNEIEPVKRIYKKNILISQPSNELLPIEKIEEPFSSNMLNIQNDGSVFIELTRGCPYKCSYCFYSKNASKVRTHNIQIILNALTNKNRRLKEIYILSPTFDKSPDYSKILKDLKNTNDGSVSLHTEMRTGGLTREKAVLLKEAGFNSMEVGLQSMTGSALKKIGRKADIDGEIEGMRHLKETGIDLKIGIIPGLPGDTPREFIKTVDRLSTEGFDDNIEFYPLMILPGTQVRIEADEAGFEYQKKPPYFIIRNDGFSSDDIMAIKEYIEEKTGFINEVRRLPDLIEYDQFTFCKGVVITDWHMLDAARTAQSIDTNVYTLRIKNVSAHELEDCLVKIQELYNAIENSQLFNIVFESSEILDEGLLYEAIERMKDDSFFTRMHLYDHWSYASRIVFYQLSEDPDFIEKVNSRYSIVEPILFITENNFKSIQVSNEKIFSLLIDRGIYGKIKKMLNKEYRDFYDKISFISHEDQEQFYKDTKQKCNDYFFKGGINKN